MPADDLLERLEAYYDAAPRWSARTEQIGPLTLFVPTTSPWPFYARPALSPGEQPRITTADVEAALERQRTLGLVEELEWVDETTPTLRAAARAAGLTVAEYPLMLLADPRSAVPVDGVGVRIADGDDPDLGRTLAAVEIAFNHGGVGRGSAGSRQRDERLAEIEAATLAHARLRVTEGRTVLVIANGPAGPVGGGTHRPLGDVTELVGIGVLPDARRRGVGAAITAALVEDAVRRGIDTVFLSAGSEEIARVYARVGFTRVATACIATR